jgi:hypothetical protein
MVAYGVWFLACRYFQVSLLKDQLENQQHKIQDLERALETKRAQLMETEDALKRVRTKSFVCPSAWTFLQKSCSLIVKEHGVMWTSNRSHVCNVVQPKFTSRLAQCNGRGFCLVQ